jgi:hypothetical protein
MPKAEWCNFEIIRCDSRWSGDWNEGWNECVPVNGIDVD